MVISHLLQNILQADLCLTGRTPKLLHLREQSPLFLAWRGEIWSMLWNLIQLLIATHHVYESRFSIPFNAGVDILDIKFSNLLILSYIAASKKSTKMFYHCSITGFSRNSMLPSLPISMWTIGAPSVDHGWSGRWTNISIHYDVWEVFNGCLV